MEKVKSVHITEMDNGFSVKLVTEYTITNMVFLTLEKLIEWLRKTLREFKED